MIFAGASAGAVLRLQCPKCSEVQARARVPEPASYACRKCGEQFTRRQGQANEAEALRSKPTRRR